MTWQTKKLGDVLDYEQPGKYIVNSKNYSGDYKTPVLTAGKTFILGNTNEKENIFPAKKLPVIIFDDFTTAIQFVDFPFKVKSSAMKILHAQKDKTDILYLFYFMQTIEINHFTHKRYWISEYSNLEISLPPLSDQKKIIKILNEKMEKIAEVKGLREEVLINTEKILSKTLHEIFKEGKKKGWEENKVVNLIEKNHKQKALPRKNYLESGKYPVVDQGQDFIDGYTNDISLVYRTNSPLVIFGDHTRILKFINFSFALGADGTQILKPKNILSPKFFYYALLSLDIKSRGYSRHFKILKEKEINFPSLPEQQKIVKRLDVLFTKIRQAVEFQKSQLEDLKKLEKAYLREAFNG